MKTERLAVQVLILLKGDQFIYLSILLIYLFIVLLRSVFFGGGGGGGGGLSSTQLLITCYGVVHNPFAFLFVLYKKR